MTENDQTTALIFLIVQKIISLSIVLIVFANSRWNSFKFILAVITFEIIIIIDILYERGAWDNPIITYIKFFLIPIIMVWRWNIVGVILATITDEIILIIPNLFIKQIDPSTYI